MVQLLELDEIRLSAQIFQERMLAKLIALIFSLHLRTMIRIILSRIVSKYVHLRSINSGTASGPHQTTAF